MQPGKLFMRFMKGSLAGLVLAGTLALAPNAAFAHGGGFGGGGGHFGGGGGQFVGGSGHFVGSGGQFVGFTGHSFAGHNFAEHQGEHFARNGDHFRDDNHFRHDDHFRLRDHFGGDFFVGDPFAYDYPYYGFDYPDYGYYDDNAGDYSDGQYSPAEVTLSQETIVAVQQDLSQLGYYHGPIDGQIGPQTAKAVRLFQSHDNLSVSGQIDSPTLKALGIS
jgi:Putative peptidoglycan binding domain